MSILNPIKRIYVEQSKSSIYKNICIELELPKEFELGYKKTKKLVLSTDACSEKEQIDELFDTICSMFGITLQKSNLTPVTFVNLFCSDKDAKVSDIPQTTTKPNNILL